MKMNNLWRLSVAITLGLAWYFCSDCVRTVIQCLTGFLLCLSLPPLFRSDVRENSSQTEEETKEHPLQETVEEELFDMTDGGTLEANKPQISQCPQVKKSLQQVFECAYAQLVLPWYRVPEPCEHQPLHKVLSREFDFVIDHIIQRSRDFDVCRAVVGSIRILTQHLHNAKQSDREPLFSSASEEMAVLRELSDALVRNLFSQSFWGQETNHCALNEIIALKGLGLAVTWLSDPDNLNQLVVNRLDGVALKGPAGEPPVSDSDQASLPSQEGDGDGEDSKVHLPGAGVSPDADIGSKRRVQRLREGWSKLVDRMKSKKIKKKSAKTRAQEMILRIMAIPATAASEDDVGFKMGPLLDPDDSEREDSDLEDYMASDEEELIEFKLSYEMWRVGHWTVGVPHADKEEEKLIFTVHLEEKDSPETLQWDIKKTYMEVIYFRNRLQDFTNLPTIFELTGSELNDEVKEEARASVEHFLQELVSDDTFDHSQLVFQFLCPLDKLLNEEENHGGLWGLVSGLAYLLTPGQEEEENSNPPTEVPKENAASPLPESSALTVENRCYSTEGSRDILGSPLPSIVVSQYKTPPCPHVEAGTNPDPQPADNSSHENGSQDKSEDSDNRPTSNLKMFIKGLTRSKSQESLGSAKSSGDEEQLDEVAGSQQVGAERRGFTTKSNKKEKTCFKMSTGASKTKGKQAQGALQRGDESQRGQVNWEQLEATKAIFDLLKEIPGNSFLINFIDAILKPLMPILKKKVNAFLNKLNPTEERMAAHVDALRHKMWPENPQAAPPPPPRTDEEKKETRERAHDLINARYSNFLVLKKADVEAVFNVFQNSEENKTLVYMLLVFLLREFLPNERSLTASAAVLQKVSSSCNGSVKP